MQEPPAWPALLITCNQACWQSCRPLDINRSNCLRVYHFSVSFLSPPPKCFLLSSGDWRNSQATQMSRITILQRFAVILKFFGWSIIGFTVVTTILLLAGEGGGKDAVALPFAFTALIVICAVTGIIPIVIGWIIRYCTAQNK